MTGDIGQGPVIRANHRDNRDAVRLAEFEVALIVSGHRHDCARAVAHQDEIADPDGDLFAGERVDGVVAGEQPFLFDVARILSGARRRPWP